MALEIEVVRDFAVIMVVLSSLTLLFYILKQPVILGYLLAGIIVELDERLDKVRLGTSWKTEQVGHTELLQGP